MSVKVSIIVPVYKVEKYLSECLDSIIEQTYKNIEIIIVDDGSPDLCPKICDNYAVKDYRIKVIHQDNQGLSGARNIGIQHATGDYVVFVDSDDKLKNDFIDKLLKLLIDTKADVACCNFLFSYPQYDKINKIKIKGTLSNDEIINFYTANRTPLFLNVVWNKLYKRNLFYPYGPLKFKTNRLQEDNFFICDLLDNIQTISIIDMPLYYYRQRSGSIMSNLSSKFIHDTIDSYVYLYEKFSYSNKFQTSINIFLINSIIGIIMRCVKNNCYNKYELEISKYYSFCYRKIKYNIKYFNFNLFFKYIIIKLRLVKLTAKVYAFLRGELK
ncbi:glycosyltransferase family 2 protein [Mitsuokella jalaludinii]|uniref:glycosyltransferase family 2 protein n=1 Tax=Mitsuokella jalaludinii TaxID=187979 RepID=UPI003F9D9927